MIVDLPKGSHGIVNDLRLGLAHVETLNPAVAGLILTTLFLQFF